MATVTLDLAKLEGMVTAKAESGVRAALGKGEDILKGDILNRAGTGELYGRHRASAPGQPPAPDLGNLQANTNANPNLERDGDDITGRIVANAEYAAALEKGTERIAARPFLGLLKSEHADELKQAFVAGAK